MPPVRFEPTVSAGERPQTYVLDRATTGIGSSKTVAHNIICETTHQDIKVTESENRVV